MSISSSSKPKVFYSSMTEEDLHPLGEVLVATFDRIRDPIDLGIGGPYENRPPVEERIAYRTHLWRRTVIEPSTSLPSSFPRPQGIVARLDPSGPPVGLALWHPPLDRTSTGGDPLPEEVRAKEEEDKREKTEWEKEVEKTMDMGFMKRFRAEQARLKKEVLAGRPCWYLQLVFCHPDIQGQGVGQALLDWGLERAREQGVPVYLEAMEQARTFYVRNGFELTGWGRHDEIEWPGFLKMPA